MHLLKVLKNKYGIDGRVFSSPGRINIIGEHTDYNDGFVLPAAIDKAVTFAIEKNGSENTVEVFAKNFNESHTFDLQQLHPIKDGGWKNYVVGVIAEMVQEGATLQGFSCAFEGTVPLGSGLSSSAALECSLAFALNEVFACGFTRGKLAHIAQKAEHNFAGVQCGIMDQFASIFGKENHVFKLDCRSKEKTYFPIELKGYSIILINTKVSHSLASSAYNERRTECETGVRSIQKEYPEVKSLRDVSIEMLEALADSMTAMVYRRCAYVINENNRVELATQALLHQDIPTLGALLYESHKGLSEEYEVSCPELDFLANYAKEHHVTGARMMGGGFGGCTINIVAQDEVDFFLEGVSMAFSQKYKHKPEVYRIKICNGAQELDSVAIH